MYQSEKINECISRYTNQTKTPKQKDEEISYLLGNLSYSFFAVVGVSSLLTVVLSLLILFPLPESKGLPVVQAVAVQVVISVFVFSFLPCSILEAYLQKNYLKKLLYLLMDKPYEVRIERVSFFNSKIKIIIEENLTTNGGSVIKEKSRHITAYTDLRLSRKDLIEFTLELVQKAESTFSK